MKGSGTDGARQPVLRFFCGLGLDIAKRELQTAELRMLVLIDAEGDVESISGQELSFLHGLRHVPA